MQAREHDGWVTRWAFCLILFEILFVSLALWAMSGISNAAAGSDDRWRVGTGQPGRTRRPGEGDLFGSLSLSLRRSSFPGVTPDVLLIIADDLGFADLTAVHDAGWAPNLWALAGQGYRFLNASSNPICSPTRRSIFTGHFYAGQSGLPCDPPSSLTPPVSLVFLPEALGPSYAKALFGKWHVGTNPFGQWRFVYRDQAGFDYWRAGLAHYVRGCLSQDYSTWLDVEDGVSHFLLGQYQPTVMRTRFDALWPVMPGPRFAVFATQLAHDPYHRPPSPMLPAGYPPPPLATDREKYESMIAALDKQIGEIVTPALLATTAVIFVGDNGTPPDVAADPAHAKTTTFQGGIHVPMFMVGPGIPSGETYALAHVADIYATVCELAGVQPQAGLDSRSLMPLVTGSAVKVHDYVASGVDSDAPPFDVDLCARSLRYKLRRVTDTWDHSTGAPGTGSVTEEFYDLWLDPQETIDLIGEPALQVKIAAHRAVIDAEFP
jgi:arylsulfatase B